MIYREVAVPAALRGAILCAWQFEVEPHDPPVVPHRIPPDGTTNLVVTRASDGSIHPSLVGPSLASVTIPVMRGFLYCGLRLRPDATRLILGTIPAAHCLEERHLTDALAPIWSDLSDFANGSSGWSATLATFGGLRGEDPVVTLAIDSLIMSGGSLSIAAIARDAGLSERQFRRRFQAACGLAPKQYADVQRLRRALILSLTEPNWAGVAAESGFSDQPHLARDIKERFGTALASVGGYFGGMRHELLEPHHVRNLQDAAAEAA
jgi:AraC-like DNA-binding protein